MYANDSADFRNLVCPAQGTTRHSGGGFEVIFKNGYLTAPEAFYCPSDSVITRNKYWYENGFGNTVNYGYANASWYYRGGDDKYKTYSHRLSGPFPVWDSEGLKMTVAIQSPDNMPLCGDVLYQDNGLGSGVLDNGGQHGNNIHIGWCDGHADTYVDSKREFVQNTNYKVRMYGFGKIAYRRDGVEVN